MIVNRELRQFISHPKGWHLSCRFYVKEIAEFFGVDVSVDCHSISLFTPLFLLLGIVSETLISDFSNYKEDDIIKPSCDIKV